MADDIRTDDAVLDDKTAVAVAAPDETPAEAPEYSDSEKRAMENGWKPKDQFSGEGWVSAEVFNARGELLTTIHKQNQKIKGMEHTLRNVHDLMQKQEKYVREKTIEELNQKKREAIESGDVSAVETYEEEIYKRKAEDTKAQPKNTPHPYVMDWAEKNKSWFNANSAENLRMRDEAVAISNEIHEKNPDIEPEEELKIVEAYIKDKYPRRFENQRKYSSANVEGNTAPPSKPKKGYDSSDITPELKKMAQDFKRRGVYETEEKYYEDYFKYTRGARVQ